MDQILSIRILNPSTKYFIYFKNYFDFVLQIQNKVLPLHHKAGRNAIEGAKTR